MRYEQETLDAAFDVALERVMGASVPDVSRRVVPRLEVEARNVEGMDETRDPKRPFGRHLATAALMLLGVGVIVLAQWPREGVEPDAAPAGPAPVRPIPQDPATERAIEALETQRELTELLPRIVAGRAEFGQVVLMEFEVGRARAMQVDYVAVPDVGVAIRDPQKLAAAFAAELLEPKGASFSYPHRLVDVWFELDTGRHVKLRVYAGEQEFGFGTGGLGFRKLSGELRRSVERLCTRLDAEAPGRFGFVSSPEEFAKVPTSIRHLVCYGVGDGDLGRLRELTALRRVQLVGRRLDEYPQRYEGVGLRGRGVGLLRGAEELEEVVLTGAGVDDEALAVLAGLPRLRRLVLEENERATFTPEALAKFLAATSARELVIDRCPHLTDRHLMAFAGARSLRQLRLDLSSAGAVGGDGVAFVAESSVEQLSIRGADCAGLFSRPAAVRSPLRSVRLEQCAVDLEGIARLPQLTTLRLSKVTIAADGLEEVGASRLERLALRVCTGLPDAGLGALGRAANLRELEISSNYEGVVWSELFPTFSGLRRLRALSLTGLRLDLEDLAAVRTLSGLDRLALQHNELDEADFEALRRDLPRTVVTGDH